MIPCTSATPCQTGTCIQEYCRTTCTDDTECNQAGGATCSDRAAERIFADFLFVTSGEFYSQSILEEVLTADVDDDGDISNGTAHSDAIYAAFGLHGWPGSGALSVTWVGPVNENDEPIDPVIGFDYEVDVQCEPPVITLKTTTKATIPVTEWRISRVASPIATMDIGRVSTQWDGGTTQVVIKVGHATAHSLGARDLNAIDVAQPGTGYSNIELQLKGGLLGQASCFSNGTNDGGRISGNVAASADLVDAYAVGTGGQGEGTLDVGTKLRSVLLDTLPVDSKLVADDYGTISIDGDIAGTIIIEGVSSASIIAGGNLTDTGMIIAYGEFNGDICSDNLKTWTNGDPIPGGIIAAFGPNATICKSEAGDRSVCAADVSAATNEPSPVAKGRFISFIPPPAPPGETIAIRVTLRSLHHRCDAGSDNPFEPCGGDDDCPNGLCEKPPPSLSDFEDKVRYVKRIKTCLNSRGVETNCSISTANCGPGETCQETTTCTDPGPSGTTFQCATLGCDAEYLDWNALTDGNVLHVTGGAVLPGRSAYDIEILHGSCEAEGDPCSTPPSCPVRIQTARWGDVDGDGNTNAIDITSVADSLKEVGMLSKVHTRLFGQVLDPVLAVNVQDLTVVIDAVKSLPFNFTNLAPCN